MFAQKNQKMPKQLSLSAAAVLRSPFHFYVPYIQKFFNTANPCFPYQADLPYFFATCPKAICKPSSTLLQFIICTPSMLKNQYSSLVPHSETRVSILHIGYKNKYFLTDTADKLAENGFSPKFCRDLTCGKHYIAPVG